MIGFIALDICVNVLNHSYLNQDSTHAIKSLRVASSCADSNAFTSAHSLLVFQANHNLINHLSSYN
jgi:hypothetical protein